MDTTIDQQKARDEALVPHVKRLRIRRRNFRLLSDIKSKESTLQLVYDVLRLTPFFKAFLVTADVLEIYMQEFWATATIHHHIIRFKMDNKKHIVNLESFREMLHICPRLPHQPFVKPPFEEEILAFLCFLGHSAVIKKLTYVNINKLHQPWRAFAAIINKCLTGKNSSYDSLRLNTKIQRRAMRCIILSSRRDNHMFSMIKLVSKHQNMQQFGALLLIELTNEDIRNSNAYKEYYAVATGATPPKPKASVWKTRSSSDTTVTPPTAAAGPRLTTSEKGKQAAKASKAKRDDDGDDEDDDGEEGNDDDDQEDEGDDVEDDEEDKGGDDEQASDEEEFIHPSLSTHTEEEIRDEESFDHIPKTLENSDDEGNGEEDLDLNVGREEGHDEEEEEEELYRDVNINQERGIQTTQEVKDSHVTLTLVNPDDQQQSLSMSSQFVTSMLNPTHDAGMESIFETTSQMDVQTPTSSDRLCEEAQKENDEFLKTIDENMQKIIKEQVKEQVKRNLYNALVEAYEPDKIILDTYGDTVTLKRRHDDDADKDEETSAGPDRGSKRRREGKEPESASAPQETATKSAGRSTQGSKSRQMSASESATTEEPMQTTFEMEEPAHPEFETGADDQPIVESSQHPEWFSQQQKPPTLDRDWNKTLSATHRSIQPWISELAKQSDSRSSFNELMDTPVDFSNYLINRLKVDTLTPKLLAGPTYALLKGSCKILKKLNLTKPDTYRSDLKHKEAYVAYSNPRGFIYQNKDKKNRLMRIDELHKFSDGTLTDVRTALDDRLKGIRMQYLP
nr:hypothetical protein [Tanacetum cinerariifolium]